MSNEQEARIALVAATYKRPGALATLLESLRSQRLDPELFEVAVVVDGLDECEEEYRKLLNVTHAEASFRLSYAFQSNAGPSVARDRAIGLTTAPWICIVDDDMDLAADFLDAHLRLLEAGGSETVVIGKVVPEEAWERQPLYEAMRTKGMLRMHEQIESGARQAEPAAFVTQNVSLSRKKYLEVGGLDAELRLGEDTELGFRLKAAGANFVFGSRASAVHRSRIGSYESWLARQFEYGRISFQLYEKLGRDPAAHPLRNLVTGNPIKSIIVHMACWWDPLALTAISFLRLMGLSFHAAGLNLPAIATHNAIMALAYHVGVKRTLGSWAAVLREERSFKLMPERPLLPS